MDVIDTVDAASDVAGAVASAGLRPLPAVALRLRRIVLGVWVAVIALVGVATTVVVLLAGGPAAVVGSVALVVVAVTAVLGWWYVAAEFRTWRWTVDAERFEVRSGLLYRRRRVVPRTRVQHVSTHAGPLQRSCGLVRLVVHTAGARTPNVIVRDLESAVADALRDELLAERLRPTSTAAIPPAGPPPSPPPVPTVPPATVPGWSPPPVPPSPPPVRPAPPA